MLSKGRLFENPANRKRHQNLPAEGKSAQGPVRWSGFTPPGKLKEFRLQNESGFAILKTSENKGSVVSYMFFCNYGNGLSTDANIILQSLHLCSKICSGADLGRLIIWFRPFGSDVKDHVFGCLSNGSNSLKVHPSAGKRTTSCNDILLFLAWASGATPFPV